MPEFRIQRPTSIADSLRALVTSSPALRASDQIAIDNHVSQVAQRSALTDKARMEVEALRTAEAFRTDPENALTYAAVQSGLTLPQARAARDWMMGVEGATRPEISDAQERGLRSFLGTTFANRLATGRTNAEQMQQGAGRGLDNMLVARASEIVNAGEQAPLLAAAGRRPREPFGGVDARGMTMNQETGQATVADRGLYDAALKAVTSLATARGAAAANSAAGAERKRADIEAGVPGSVVDRNAAAAAASRASAGQKQADMQAGGPEARADAARGRGEAASARAETTRADNDMRRQGDARARFARDPAMKGNKVGAWIPGKGYEVRNKDGKLIGHYD